MKSVKWLRPIMTAVAKHHGLKDPGFIAKQRRESKKTFEHWCPLTVEDLADETGDYIALSARMVDWLMSIKAENVANTDHGWHIPYRAFRVGVEDGSSVPPFIACWMPISEYQALNPPAWGFKEAECLHDYPASEWVLFIGMRSRGPDGDPTITSSLFNHLGIAETIRGAGRYDLPPDNSNGISYSEKNQMNAALRLTVALGIYLSLGVDAPEIPSAVSKKIAPPPRDRPAGYRLRAITEPPGGSGRTPHLVRPHVRCLKHERYYQGVWADYPRGSRYSLVSAHVRGHQSETEHDADLHGVV